MDDSTRSSSVLVGLDAADHFQELLETFGSDEISNVRCFRDLEQITDGKLRDAGGEIGGGMHVERLFPEGVAVALEPTEAFPVARAAMLQPLLQVDKGPLKPTLPLNGQVGFSSAELM